jgi:NAD-dependent SIR2 family protein deacetylase
MISDPSADLSPSRASSAHAEVLGSLAELCRDGPIVVLTGAGCSTESGIPDYRGPETAARARNPMEYKAFVGDAASRQRYWSRSLVGWPRVGRAQPNPAHLALATLEERGLVAGLITQNVDGLHRRGGSRRLIELHGDLERVVCIGCRRASSRDVLQRRLRAANPSALAAEVREIAPDGDAVLAIDHSAFEVPACEGCGGVLKPDVVFFGEAVPLERVRAAEEMVDHARALLVVGTSLAVYSGLRFVRRARARGLPCALINLGPPMRGAELFDLHVDEHAGRVLPELATVMTGQAQEPSRS